MSETITTKAKLTALMLQIQYIIDEDYEENDYIQTAFNNLAIALDEEIIE